MKEPSDAMNRCIAELDSFVSRLDDTLHGDEIFKKYNELLELHGPQMTIEEAVQMFGGYYMRVEPVKA